MSQTDFTLEQQLAVCQQIARLVRAKLPISGELAEAAKQTSRKHSDSAKAVDQRVGQGQTLSDALAGDDSRDSRMLAACIESGELSDSLDRALESWAGMHVATAQAARAMRTAMLYPMILIAVTMLSLAFVIWKLIPEYRTTYVLFDLDMPQWLNAIVWIREYFGILMITMLLFSIGPVVFWFLQRRRIDVHGLPLEPSRRMRLQALSSEIAGNMLQAGVPMNRIAAICTMAGGGGQDDSQQAFSRLQKQQHMPPLARESSMLLSSLHAGLVQPDEAVKHLRMLASHLRQNAEITASRQARWLPMLVALTTGAVTILTYVFLIYLPWIWLLRKMSMPEASQT